MVLARINRSPVFYRDRYPKRINVIFHDNESSVHDGKQSRTRIFIRRPLLTGIYASRPTLCSFVIDLSALKDMPRRRIFLPPRQQRISNHAHAPPPPVLSIPYSLSKLSRKYSRQTISVAFFAFVRLLTIISEP